MIDYACCFTRGGVLLWSFCFAKLHGTPIEFLIKNILLDERAGSSCAKVDSYAVQWFCLNSLKLVFAAVYKGVRQIQHIDILLEQTAYMFEKRLNDVADVLDYPLLYPTGQDPFDTIFMGLIVKMQTNKNRQQQPKHIKNRLKRIDGDGVKKGGKPMRQWDTAKKITRKDMENLDHSKKTEDGDGAAHAMDRRTFGADSDPDSSDDDVVPENEESGWIKFLPKTLLDFAGNKLLTEEDINEVLPSFREYLSSKNVAEEVIDLLHANVTRNIMGSRTASFTTVRQTIRAAMRESIVKLLTPKKSVDVLRQCLQAKAEGRIYSIVFLGINGVGKSTNLAKVAYYLKNKGGLNILIAACDTFRAGAVEQLRTHARCLDVPLFERGYGKDAAAIAREAIHYAKGSDINVVLIDTAGRMQDNEPLMRALSKLVLINNPDLILFVGEALVGNDAVDQLKKFNQALIDMTADTPNPRLVDGILLTKFDAVDDKVGAALSMVYITGQPVVFVGTGQKYQNLKKLNPDLVVNALLG